MAKILIVDDEPDIVRVVSRILESRGHEICTACDGLEALEQVRKTRPDAVIIDLFLPNMDGNEVCRRLKDDQATRDIPIIIMTASHVSIEDAHTRGADEYVMKPFLREVLIRNVERLLPEASVPEASVPGTSRS